MANRRPNFLLIMTDQQRYDMLNATVGGPCRSPGLDELARTGVTFTEARTPCALCTPARASLFTGLYPHNHGLLNNCDMFSAVHRNMPHRERFLHLHLAAAGYNLGFFGKWHVDTDYTPLDEGFEGVSVPAYGLDASPGYGFRSYPMPAYDDYLRRRGLTQPEFHPTVTTDAGKELAGYIDDPLEASVPFFLSEEAISYMREKEKGESPFFATVQFWGPHEVAKPSKSYLDQYTLEEVPIWENYEDDLSERPAQYLRHRDEFECWYYGASELGPARWREATRAYFAYSTMIDDQILRLLRSLEELGIAENTVVLYTSDHGNYSGARGGLFDKGVGMFEDIYRVPMFLRWPGVTGPRRQEQLVSVMDLMPTVLDIAGAELPEGLDGESLVPILREPCNPGREEFVAEDHGTYYLHSQRMIVHNGYKYVFTPYDSDELYNLNEDPQELRNLIGRPEEAATLRELRRRLIARTRESNDPLSAVIEGFTWRYAE
ncbi:MAG: sulfatase-like hydrolase/transferase [Alkalispirochaetaceae bacterium]